MEFPQADSAGTAGLPPDAQFLTPALADHDDDQGIGHFQDTWLIKDVSVADAEALIDTELRMANAIAQLDGDADDFERFAQLVESGGIDDPAYHLSERERAILSEVASDIPELEGLDLGVAGLVYALAAVRIVPAASCRSHQEKHTWSSAPVVLFAATEHRARALVPLAEATVCTFSIDPARPELLTVRGHSIANTMALAQAIMANRGDFSRRRTMRR